SGCSSKKATSTGSSSTPTTTAAAPSNSAPAPSTAGASGQDLNAMLPASIKSSGTINIATDASYAPNEFFDTKEREQTVDFVTYFSAGESLIVASGNPKGVTGPDLTLCGLTVAVEKGTTEESEVPDLSKKCTDAGKKAVTALSTDDQNGAN